MDIPTREAKRLRLRPFQDGDAQKLYPMMSDRETIRYFPFKSIPSEEHIKRLVARQQTHWERYGHGWWAIELRETKTFIGWCGLQYLDETDEIEIGYLIAKPYWGKGYATEAAQAALQFAFNDLKLDAVLGIVHPDNIGSIKVLEKMGGADRRRDCYFEMDCYRYILQKKAFQALHGGEPSESVISPLADRAEHGRAIASLNEANWERGEAFTNALYETARLKAMCGKRLSAYSDLDLAVRAGFWDAGRLQEDSAFAHIRKDEAFRSLVKGAWANGYIAMLEREDRDEIQKPEEVMISLGFRPGEVVAEIGPGSGYFTVRVARAVGPEGKVFANDASQEMLDYLIRRLRVERLTNVVPTKISSHNPGLPEGGVDTVLMVDVLHYIPEKAAYAQKLKARLRPGGRVIVIDYTVKSIEERPWGPPPEQQVSREVIDKAMAEAGLRVKQAFDFLPEQYIVVYEAAV